MSRIRNCNKSIYDRIHRYLGEPTNDLHSMNKFSSYLTEGNNNFLKNIKRNIINKNLLVWGKNERSIFYCDDTKRGRFNDFQKFYILGILHKPNKNTNLEFKRDFLMLII